MKGAIVRFFSWLGGHELSVLVAFAAISAGVLIFTAVAGEVIEGDTQSVDRKILLAFRVPGTFQPIGSEPVEVLARDITALGGVTVLTLLTVFVAAFLVLDGKGHMAKFVLTAVFGGMTVSVLLKEFFQRPRPEIVPHLQYVAHSSFPSGHSMMSAATYLTLGALLARSQKRRAIRSFLMVAAALLTFVIGVSRVFLGVHWPSDVLAGWVAGAVWAAACWLVARRLQHRQELEPPTPDAS